MSLHPGYVFLARASARCTMVEHGEMTVEEALDGLLEPFRQIAPLYCYCECEGVARMEHDYPPIRKRPRRAAA
jgi:hypothetical protein